MHKYREETENKPLLAPSNRPPAGPLPHSFSHEELENDDRDSGTWWHAEAANQSEKARYQQAWRWLTFLFLMMTLALIATIVILLVWLPTSDGRVRKNWLELPPSASLLTKYKYSTIATDAAPCVNIGNFITLVKHGSVIDATIATMLCTGVYNMHSMGISGGSFLVYYEKSTRKTYTLDFRETAPLAANETMFVGKAASASLYGGLSIAVPGEIAGYYAAWKKWGKVPWPELFEPTIELLRNGSRIFPSLNDALLKNLEDVKTFANPTLKNYLHNAKNDRWITTGDYVTNPNLANTLEVIANEPLAMYNGSLVDTIVTEIQQAGGIITAEDLKRYKPEWREAVSIPLTGTNYVIHGMQPPSSGAMCAFILNILSGYGYHTKNISTKAEVGTYFHRFVEASKFAFAKRSALGDMAFATAEMKEVYKSLLDVSNAEKTRLNISDSQTFDASYYGGSFDIPEDRGTSHISAVDEEGNAVSLTSTINGEFGSMILGEETGIMYNNEMDDFSSPNKTNQYHLPPSPSNFIQPGKRPMSSMSPLIVTDSSTGRVRLVLGGSGGSRILSAVAQVAGHHLFLNKNIKQANDMWRFHHQLYPNEIRLSSDFPEGLKEELKSRGHIFGEKMPGTAIQALTVNEDGFIYGNADYRKNGQAGGI